MKKKVLILISFIFLIGCSHKLEMPDFYNKSVDEVITFAQKNNIQYEIKEEYNDEIKKDNIVTQSIEKGSLLTKESVIIVTKSLGKDLQKEYIEYQVNESGNIPIMMYHGIVDMKDSETKYTGGNYDKDGFARTAESFRRDLDFYYNEGYRMIRLIDLIDGNIDVSLGKSPIVLTFDDGLSNNIKVNGIDESGNLIIDENCAVGILEEYKKKYPDFNITASFFINGDLFNQSQYNEQILNWLIDHNYDIGNHTISHPDFTKLTDEEAQKEVGKMYKILNDYLKNNCIKVVALPFGSPYNEDHHTFPFILKGEYDGFKYETLSTLRVGWEAEYSPFNQKFNPMFLKRIRAYDNNGLDFDIEYNFNILRKNRYISDGDPNTIVVPNEKKDVLNTLYNKTYIYY